MDIDEVCRYFYDKEYITPKEMTNLILGNDPRKKILKNTYYSYKSTIEKICYKFNCKPSTELDSKELFKWAVEKFDTFKPTIPQELNPPLLQNINTFFAPVVVSGEYEKVMQDLGAALHKINEQDVKIKALEEEIIRLSEYEKKSVAKKESCSKGGKKSKGVKKNYR